MGLSIVYGVVKQHNGWVEVITEPGQGAEFSLSFRLKTAGLINNTGRLLIIIRFPNNWSLINSVTNYRSSG